LSAEQAITSQRPFRWLREGAPQVPEPRQAISIGEWDACRHPLHICWRVVGVAFHEGHTERVGEAAPHRALPAPATPMTT
jgi:hypothetical protein